MEIGATGSSQQKQSAQANERQAKNVRQGECVTQTHRQRHRDTDRDRHAQLQGEGEKQTNKARAANLLQCELDIIEAANVVPCDAGNGQLRVALYTRHCRVDGVQEL